MDELSVPKVRRPRRRHSPEFKARIVEACQEPGASVARVALDHGLNDNLVRRWIKTSASQPAVSASGFVPLALPLSPAATTVSPVSDDVIRIEVPLADGVVTLNWPVSCSDQVMPLLRELLL